MRLHPRSSPHHLGAALLSAITIGAVLAPVAVSADEERPETGRPETEQPVLDIGSPDDIGRELSDDHLRAVIDEPTSPDQPAATLVACDDLLAVATTNGILGDDLAVAITARAFDADAPGWSNIGWEAATGTVLRTVFVTGTDGTVTEAGDATSATDVASLSFCGVPVPPSDEAPRTAADPASPSSPTSTEPRTPETPEATHGTPAATSDASAAAPGSPTPPASPGPAPAERTTHGSGPGLTVETAPAPETSEPSIADPNRANDFSRDNEFNDEEVAVMGIQLAREEQPGGNGPPIMTGALPAIALLAIALLATSGGVLPSRRS